MTKNRFTSRMGIPLFAGTLALAMLSAPDASAKGERKGAMKTPHGAAAAREVTATVTVQDVDPARNSLTIRDEAGDTVSLTVSPEVRNLDAIKPGDKVKIRYLEAVALRLGAPGERQPVSGMEEPGTTGMEGDMGMEGGMAARQMTATAEIMKVDKKKNTVTFKGPDDKTYKVTVQDPQAQQQLSKLKKGDQIAVTYTEAVALSVQPAS